MTESSVKSLVEHLSHRPDLQRWPFDVATCILFAMFAGGFGLASGLFSFRPVFDVTELARLALISLVLPSVLEETVFRGPIRYWQAKEGRVPIWFLVILLVAFVAWHPINASLILTQAQDLFFDWRFLIIAAALGLAATVLTLNTRSLWPPIIFHWMSVLLWKVCFGGPAFF